MRLAAWTVFTAGILGLLIVFSSEVAAGHSESTSTAAMIRIGGVKTKITIDATTSAVDGTLNVHFANGSTAKVPPALVIAMEGKSVLSLLGMKTLSVEPIRGIDALRVTFRTSIEAIQWSERLANDHRVRFVHPDFIYELEAREFNPDQEPLFKDQWNLENFGQSGGTSGVDIDVKSAWRVTTGKPETIIGLLDLGFEQNHEDLQDSWYVNKKEIPGNKMDDDGNGLIDDVSGWNFSINGSNLIYGANNKHGTATAGIIGARANGKGVIGICPGCKTLPIVVSGRVSEDAAAIMYAVQMGVSVLSNSWGYKLNPPQTDVVTNALVRAAHQGRGGKGIPVIFAMRNAGVDDCREQGPDISAHPDVIAVASVDHHDVKVPETAFGKCIAFLAPSGVSAEHGIATTDRAGANGYNSDGVGNFSDLAYNKGFWGTSAAAPQVAGLFALLLSHEPELTLTQAMLRMRDAAVKIQPEIAKYDTKTGHSNLYGYGRVSATKLFPHN